MNDQLKQSQEANCPRPTTS